jgi:hypothetical protein
MEVLLGLCCHIRACRTAMTDQESLYATADAGSQATAAIRAQDVNCSGHDVFRVPPAGLGSARMPPCESHERSWA